MSSFKKTKRFIRDKLNKSRGAKKSISAPLQEQLNYEPKHRHSACTRVSADTFFDVPRYLNRPGNPLASVSDNLDRNTKPLPIIPYRPTFNIPRKSICSSSSAAAALPKTQPILVEFEFPSQPAATAAYCDGGPTAIVIQLDTQTPTLLALTQAVQTFIRSQDNYIERFAVDGHISVLWNLRNRSLRAPIFDLANVVAMMERRGWRDHFVVDCEAALIQEMERVGVQAMGMRRIFDDATRRILSKRRGGQVSTSDSASASSSDGGFPRTIEEASRMFDDDPDLSFLNVEARPLAESPPNSKKTSTRSISDSAKRGKHQEEDEGSAGPSTPSPLNEYEALLFGGHFW